MQIASLFLLGYGEALRAERGSRQGTTGLLSYLYHQYSELLFNRIFPFEANDGTWQRAKPLLMQTFAPYIQTAILIGRCPGKKGLRLLVHVPTQHNPRTKPPMLSTTETCHPSVMGNPEKDDQLEQWNRHIPQPQREPDKTQAS